jgi:hypothetical protein
MNLSKANAWKSGLLAMTAAAAVLGAGAGVTPTFAIAATTTHPAAGHALGRVLPASGSITFQAANLGSYDQFVVTFPEATAPALSASDSDSGPIWAGSGKPVAMPGNHFIYLTGRGSNDPLAGPNPVTYPLPNLESAVLYDDFEGSIGIALGLDHAASYTVTTSGNQVMVDVAH